MSAGSGFRDNVVGFERPIKRSSSAGGPSDSGGGEPPIDMKERIEALEKGHREILDKLGDITGTLKAIDAKLDAKADAAALERVGGDVRVALSDVRGILVGKASATDVSNLQGEVSKLPGTGALITLVLATLAGSLGGAATLAYTLAKYLRPGGG